MANLKPIKKIARNFQFTSEVIAFFKFLKEKGFFINGYVENLIENDEQFQVFLKEYKK